MRANAGWGRHVAVGAAALWTLVGPAGAVPANAQRPAVPPVETSRLAVVVSEGVVYLFPSRIPADGEGWRITRDGRPLGSALLTGVRSAQAFASAVGEDLPLLQRIAGDTSLVGMYRALRTGTAGSIAQVLSPRAAIALGGLYVDSAASPRATHRYVAELVRLARPETVVSRASATVTVIDTPLPVAPLPRAEVREADIALQWTAPPFTGASGDVTVAYIVERADSVGAFQRVSSLPVMRLADRASGWQDDALVRGHRMRYRLRGVDLIGRVSAPGPSVTVRHPAERGPLPPPQVAAVATNGRIRVVWTVSPEPRTRGFIVERAVGQDTVFRRVTKDPLPADVPEFTDSLVRGRELYTYRVRAVDGEGRIGAPSNGTTARGLDGEPPRPPTALGATLLAGRRARLVWQAPPDRDLRGYVVARAEGPATGTAVAFARLVTEPQRGVVFVDSGYGATPLEPGRRYTWRVVAVDSSGNESPGADVMLEVPDDEPPLAVRSLSLQNHLGRDVVIAWTASPSADVARYEVTRIDSAGATVPVATVVAGGALAARDTSARRGRRATWRVVPVDSAGNRGEPVQDTLTLRAATRPPAPRRVTAVRDGEGVRVRWERVASRSLAGYAVYRIAAGAPALVRAAVVPPGITTWRDPSPRPSMRYVVRAIDEFGTESSDGPVAVVVERP
jgi:fibronectin type 3 domain-containing protein